MMKPAFQLSSQIIFSIARSAILLATFLLALTGVQAQWQTQHVMLKPGWNAVFLHVDASHTGIADVAPSPIDAVWLWQPVHAPDRFLNDPQQPMAGNDWANWHRPEVFPGQENTLARLIGNAAYLVLNGSNNDLLWSIVGKPVPPSYRWTSRGVNFIGFSTPSDTPPLFNDFLSPAQRLASGGEFFRYDDGDNDLTPSLFNALFHTVPVRRGQAFWIRHPDLFNRYFGAFDLVLQNPSGVHFGASGSQYSVRIRNATSQDLELTLSLLDSEAAPANQRVIVGKPPLIVRGDRHPQNLTYAYHNLAGDNDTRTIFLKPQGQAGSETEVILGVNRSAMNGNPGDLFAGILRITDALGYTQMDLPVSANQASKSGLWVGNVLVNQVRHYLKNYQRDADKKPVTDANGAYQLLNTDTSLGSVARPFNLRLIVHKSADKTRLYQRLYHGIGLENQLVITTRENLLNPDELDSARRISATHLPFSEDNSGWPITGTFAQGGSVTARVDLEFGDYTSNPFLHAFHPDHDNLNATFGVPSLVRGFESYDVDRTIKLTFAAPADDFDSLTSGGNQLNGNYEETITFKGLDQEKPDKDDPKKKIVVTESLAIGTAGAFIMRRVSEIDTVTLP